MKISNLINLIVLTGLIFASSACIKTTGDSITSDSIESLDGVEEVEDVSEDDAEFARLIELEEELLELINQEREDAGLPRLERDPGLDLIMLSYGLDMVLYHHIGHEDIMGRYPKDRVDLYTDRDDSRCSEITAWFSGSDNAVSHYEGYKASQGHHDAYMEVGMFNLGPTTHVGVVALAGTGPSGSNFEGKAGTYTGLIFCAEPANIAIDPFEN